ncbi:MAG TPA: PH domain-containing protein [Thermomicrobiales bacterium]|nr:PH domain-containing protein [Thermomicrobiales bacterium]
MSYVDELLASDEEIRLIAHRHVVFLLLRTIPLLLGAMLLWVLAYVTYDQLDTGQTIGTLGLLALSLIPLAIAAYRYFSWHREQYALTNYRIIQVEGIINKRTFDSSLEKINDVQMTQGLFARIFGYGDIFVMTGSEIGVNQLYGIADPFTFKRTLQEAKLQLSDDDRPRRFASAPVETAAAPAVQPAGAASGTDAARLMAALVDLRDSGVISPAEYEERRNQLLQQQ